MKKIHIICIVLASLLLSCTGQNGSTQDIGTNNDHSNNSSVNQGTIRFDTLFHDFGTLIEGEQVVCYFDYENIGNGDLVIQSVESSCGCTVPDWSGQPLKPNGKGTVKVMFDTSGRGGEQAKIITILSNATNPEVRLKISANIATEN